MRTTAVCTTTIRRDLLLQLLNPYHTIEVACPLFCVLRDEHLAIHRPVNFRLACCWHRLLYTPLISSSRHIRTLRLLAGGSGAPGRPTLCPVDVRLVHLLGYHRPPRRRSA